MITFGKVCYELPPKAQIGVRCVVRVKGRFFETSEQDIQGVCSLVSVNMCILPSLALIQGQKERKCYITGYPLYRDIFTV